ncbi:hypothetical protein L210DRAFT_3759068 [Boletus edulis BED1]|uniref:Uncharacterized protein n=1 Tax=Boletus edulis BED1 TaxID=1328754 RepID=A0AAD4GI82_BOLED|nr:hypothetical protein L210DRAFT_3759068 [Boletus edulis BED1]
MHPALQIQEILLATVFRLVGGKQLATADLAALARTCHAFKDPALDVSTYPTCTVSAGSVSSGVYKVLFASQKAYTERVDILQSYTRRIRSIAVIVSTSILVSLTVKVHNLRLLKDSLKSLSQTSPSLCKLLLQPCRVNMDRFDTAFMCQCCLPWDFLGRHHSCASVSHVCFDPDDGEDNHEGKCWVMYKTPLERTL